MIVSYSNTTAKIPEKWHDITIRQAIECAGVELPDVTDTFDWFQHLPIVKKYITILTTIKEPDKIEPSWLVHIFSKYLVKFIIDLKSPSPETYTPLMIEYFSHKGKTYLMPERLDIGVNIILQHGQTTKNFIEASNLMKQFSQMRKDGIKVMPMLVASMVKEERLEEFDEVRINERAKEFEDLPMNIVWEVFFCLSLLIIKLGKSTLQYMSRKESKMERLIKYMDSKRGLLLLRRAELRELLKKSTE